MRSLLLEQCSITSPGSFFFTKKLNLEILCFISSHFTPLRTLNCVHSGGRRFASTPATVHSQLQGKNRKSLHRHVARRSYSEKEEHGHVDAVHCSSARQYERFLRRSSHYSIRQPRSDAYDKTERTVSSPDNTRVPAFVTGQSLREQYYASRREQGLPLSLFENDDGSLEKAILEESLISERHPKRRERILRVLKRLSGGPGSVNNSSILDAVEKEPPWVVADSGSGEMALSSLDSKNPQITSEHPLSSSQLSSGTTSFTKTVLSLNLHQRYAVDSCNGIHLDPQRLDTISLTALRPDPADCSHKGPYKFEKRLLPSRSSNADATNAPPTYTESLSSDGAEDSLAPTSELFEQFISAAEALAIPASGNFTGDDRSTVPRSDGYAENRSTETAVSCVTVRANGTAFNRVEQSGVKENAISRLKVQALTQEAEDYAQSFARGALKGVATYYPGIERQQRHTEMMQHQGSLMDLIHEGRATQENVNLLLKALSLQGKVKVALEMYDQAIEMGFRPDAETFVALIQGAAENRDAPAARLIYLKMRSQLIFPTLRVYGALINAHIREGDIAAGYSLLEKMENEKLKPDVVIYTTLINGLVEAKRFDEAWQQFRDMRTWKLIEPDEVLFTVMIKACAMQEQPEKALAVLDDLRASQLYPTDVTYTELIHACCRDPHFSDKAFELLNQMEAEDMPLTVELSEYLLAACATKGDVARARAVLQKMHKRGLLPSRAGYEYLIRTLTAWIKPYRRNRARVHAAIQQTWGIITAIRQLAHEQVTTSTLNVLIEFYSAVGQQQHAVDTLEHFPRFNVQPDGATYMLLLTMFVKMKDLTRFFRLWDFLKKETHLVLTIEMFELAVFTAIEAKALTRTQALLEDMYRLKIFPTAKMTAELARVGRHLPELTQLMAMFVTLQNKEARKTAKIGTELIMRNIEEHELRQFARGRTSKSLSPEDQVRKEMFEQQEKRLSARSKKRLPHSLYKQLKKEGGEYFAAQVDKPAPNLLSIQPIVKA